MPRWLVVLPLLAAADCTTVARCASGTLYVSLTLSGTTVMSDTLDVAISVGGGASMMTPVAHQAGVAKGSIEVQFPSGYPRGQSIAVAITAKQNGLPLGSGSGMTTLSAACGALSLDVTTTGSSVDLAGADLTGAPMPDFAGVDLAGLDLAVPPDMALPVDLAGVDLVCVPLSGNEDCFNGIDDNCDGLVDCADPQCTATTTCVPALAGAAYGTVLSSAGPCPQSGATTTLLYGAFNPGSCSGCSTSLGVSATPTLVIRQFTPACNGTIIANITATDCSQPVPSSGGITESLSGINCNTATGTPSYSPGSFTTDQFCTSPAVGGGCSPGNVCVPKVGSDQSCVLVGSGASCTGYASNVTPSFGTWYTDKTITEACDSCANAMLEPTAQVFFCSTPSCGCGGTYIGNCPSTTLNSTYYLGIQNPGCLANAKTTGTFAGAGTQMKVCCM
jgi:hypothetical protein